MKRILRMPFAILALLLCARAAAAQAPITEAPLTPEVSARLVAAYNSAGTRLSGDSEITPASDVSGEIALLNGSLTLSGHIRGRLLIVNGDLIVEPGAMVDDTVTIVGGAIRGSNNLRAPAVLWYRERLKYELREGTLELGREVREDELAAGHQFDFGRTDLVVRARGGYNRSEGLPVHVGPRITLGNRNPTLLEGNIILRSAAGYDFDEDDFGFVVKIEQYFGARRLARGGFRVVSETLPIESTGLSDRENSLAAFVLHRDYRDHYVREGWSAYLESGRPGMAFDWGIEYANNTFENAALRDPVSLLHNADPWRPEVATPEVRLRAVRLRVGYDTRNEDRDPAYGWLLRAEAETPLTVDGNAAAGFPSDYHYAAVDVRRYARLSPYARLSVHARASGSLTGVALPTFRQQALGGEGSLPGYDAFELDCGAHDSSNADNRWPYYGCDKLLLLQLEYQSNFLWLNPLRRALGSDFGLLNNVKAVLFFDAGRAWSAAAERGVRMAGKDEFVADAGAGLRFGLIGAYWAIPLSAHDGGINFFIRLEPRF